MNILGTIAKYLKFFLFSQQENRSRPPHPPFCFPQVNPQVLLNPPTPPSVFLKLNLKFSKKWKPQVFSFSGNDPSIREGHFWPKTAWGGGGWRSWTFKTWEKQWEIECWRQLARDKMLFSSSLIPSTPSPHPIFLKFSIFRDPNPPPPIFSLRKQKELEVFFYGP